MNLGNAIMRTINIVVPVYNEVENIRPFVENVQKQFLNSGIDFNIVFVSDPSKDGTEVEIESLCTNLKFVKHIALSRRFGQPAAIIAGLENSKSDATIVMDVDLQDPPELIPKMIMEWKSGAKIVIARRVSRSGEHVFKKLTAKFGYAFLNKFADVPIPKDSGDFRLMDRSVVSNLMKYSESRVFLRGLISLVGFEAVFVDFDRPARAAGKSKYNQFTGSIRIALDGIIGFSNSILNISTIMGIILSMVSFVTASGYLLAKIFGVNFPIGNATVVILVLLVGGLNLFTLGILGLYVGRIYDESRKRPRYIIKHTTNLS
jgi:glycosyltransferase involved in cell wall biosynthesis